MTRSRILPMQTAMHFAGLAITKMQSAFGRTGPKPTRPGSVSAASLVLPRPVWETISPGILALAKAFGLNTLERASYHVSPDMLLIEFVERR